mmetsp:Transcript_20955/g.35771  ORF Transcript_20955/g.35771 Transcript_20955/m.35771 type:complete len:81 (-) Transcript_20955:29-271(-)
MADQPVLTVPFKSVPQCDSITSAANKWLCHVSQKLCIVKTALTGPCAKNPFRKQVQRMLRLHLWCLGVAQSGTQRVETWW